MAPKTARASGRAINRLGTGFRLQRLADNKYRRFPLVSRCRLIKHDTSGAPVGPGATLVGDAVLGGQGKPLVGGSPKRRRYRLSIDGEEFDVRSPEEAQALLEQARQLAQERAETALQRANKAKGRRKTEILKDARKALPEPRIEVDDQALQAMVQAMVGEISALYRSALQAIEISALLRRVEQDEEDALLAMML